MSGMTSEALALLRKDIYADPVGSEQDLLAHVDHLTAENARLREGILDMRDSIWTEDGLRRPLWNAAEEILNPPTEGETDEPV